jgi:hypothetical protein
LIIIAVDCGTPELRDNIVLDPLTNSSTALGSIIRYYCAQDLRSNSDTTSVCSISGRWIPNPMKYSCTISPNDSEGILLYNYYISE